MSRPGRVLLLANDDGAFNRTEQEALVACYPGANECRYLNAGHLLGLTRAHELERKLEYFFRIQADPQVLVRPPMPRPLAASGA